MLRFRYTLSLLAPFLLLSAGCANFDADGGYLGVLLLSGGSGGAGSNVPADWWDASFRKRRKLTFDNSSRGALASLPVLVQLTSARIDYASTSTGGSDLCFVAADTSSGGTALAHEIEQWNSGGTSILWVELPSLTAGSSSDYIYMYYDGGSCSTTASSAWNSNYKAVWHLNSSLSDSTANGNSLVATGTTQTTGLFGGALSFNGAGDQLEDADGENYINGNTALTFSAWVRATATGSDQGIFYAGAPAGSDNLPGLRHDASGANAGCTNCFKASMDVSGSIRQLESSSNIQSTSWAYVTLVRQSGSQMQFYLNGALDTPTDNSAALAGSITNATTVIVGRGGKDNGGTGWDGLIDEVRVSATAESADWISAQYASMTDALITYDSTDEEI